MGSNQTPTFDYFLSKEASTTLLNITFGDGTHAFNTTLNQCVYWKFGDFYVGRIKLNWTAKTGVSGNVRIGNLPFNFLVPSSGTDGFCGYSIGGDTHGVTATSGLELGNGTADGTVLYFYDGAASGTKLTDTAFATSGYLDVTFWAMNAFVY